MSEVDNKAFLALILEAVAMVGYTLDGGKFGLDIVFVEGYAIVSGLSLLLFVGEMRTVVLLMQVGLGHIAYEGHNENITKVLAAGTAQMGVRESIEGVVAIVVGASAVPPFETGVRTGLYHSERIDGSGIGVTMEIGSYKRIDVFGNIVCACRKHERHAYQKRIEQFSHRGLV